MFFIVFPFFFVNIFVALIIITFQEQGEAGTLLEILDCIIMFMKPLYSLFYIFTHFCFSELSEGDLDKNQVLYNFWDIIR